VPPLRDDKQLAAWNGLMISGLAVGARVLGEPRYAAAAARAADFLLTHLREGDGLRRSFTEGHAAGGGAGFLDDYAFVAAGLFDLYEATFEARWLREALALADATQRRFGDAARGGWFMTSGEHETLIAREKPAYDGAEPSGTSVALRNALRAFAFTGDERWREVAAQGFGGLHAVLEGKPVAITEALLALDTFTDAAREIALVWPAGGEAAGGAAAEPLRATLRRVFLPNAAIAGAADGAGVAALAEIAPWMAGKLAQSGKATAYVCEHGHCELPATDPALFAQQLAKPPRGY